MFEKVSIRKVTPIGVKGVYDLSVKGCHQFVANGILHHNSRGPNGQNIPKTAVNPDIKPQFITPPGQLFMAYDYSQAELRILSHLAGEDSMLSWFREGKDIHLASACKKYGENYEDILKIYENEQHPEYKKWKVRRKEAKTINFGVVYEQSAPMLAENLSTPEHHLTPEEGQQFLDDFFTTFPKIRQFMDKQHKLMEKQGYVSSLFGRKRRCPKVYSEKYGEYLEALRQCVDDKTEALSFTQGWVTYDKLKEGELILTKNPKTDELEWQKVKKLNIYPDYHGDLYEFTGKCFSAITNGKHRWLCSKSTKHLGINRFVTTEDLYKSKVIRPIHRTGVYIGQDHIKIESCIIKLLGLILTDGHFRYYNDPTKPRYGKPWFAGITQSKPHVIRIIDEVVDEARKFGVGCTKKVVGDKHIWRFNKGFADTLDKLIPNKKLTMRLLTSLSSESLRVLLEYMKLGDGIHNGRAIIAGDIEQAGMIQILNVLCGYYSNIREVDNRGVHYSDKVKLGSVITKNISYIITSGINKHYHHKSTRGINHISKINNPGCLIWCPTVENGTWVCRREGKQYITGNSTNMPCQSAASDMALFASVIVFEQVRTGKLPPMTEVNTVHDSVYQFIKPQYLTPDVIYKIWDICRNPSTKEYFGFSIDDVDMSMDFTIGRTMAEELPYIPGYDYKKLFSDNFNVDEYYAEYNKVKHIPISAYPREFAKYFKESWRKRK